MNGGMVFPKAFRGFLRPSERSLYAFAKSMGTRINVEFVIIGNGDQTELLKVLFDKLGIATRVRFLGFIGLDEVPSHFLSSFGFGH